MAKANVGEYQKLFADKETFGVGQYGENVCFKYRVTSKTTNVDFRVKQFSGVSSLTINPKEIAKDNNDAKFHASHQMNQMVRLTPRMRKAEGQETGAYFVCLFSHTFASFSVLVTERDPAIEKYTSLDTGFGLDDVIVSQKDTLTKNVYVYPVPKLQFAEQDIKLQFGLQTQYGPLPRMVVLYCNFKQGDMESSMEKCDKSVSSLSPEDILGRAKSTTDEVKYLMAKQIPGVPFLLLELDHDEESCNGDKDNCVYAVIVISNQADLLDSEPVDSGYFLAVASIQKNYQLLNSEQPLLSVVQQDSLRFFKYTMHEPESHDLEKISFQLLSLHGDADLFVSRIMPFPDEHTAVDRSSKKDRSVVDRVDYQTENGGGDLVGDFFIGVKGYHQDSSFEV